MNDWQQQNEIVIFVGTRKLAVFQGSLGDRDPAITRHVTVTGPRGFQSGFVSDLDQATSSLQSALEALQPNLRSPETSCYVVLGNSKLWSYRYSSSQYYQGMQRTITSQDVRSVVNQTRSIATLPLTEFVLQAVPESFLVNDMTGVRNPLGLEAHRLGVDLNIFTMTFQDFKNLNRVFESLELDVRGYFPKTLTVSEAVLTDQEKQEGVLIVDIADDTAHLVLWKNGSLAATKSLPLGGKVLTDRIAEKWEIGFQDAEKVKERYATLETDPVFTDELIPLVERNGHGKCPISRREFYDAFLGISQEWLSRLVKEMKTFSDEHRVFYPHFVFTGGGIRIDGFLESLQKNFSLSGRIGLARKIEAPAELVIDPSVAAGLGMFRWLNTNAVDHEKLFAPRGILEKTISSARHWFSAYF